MKSLREPTASIIIWGVQSIMKARFFESSVTKKWDKHAAMQFLK